jgi:hypothetical protein
LIATGRYNATGGEIERSYLLGLSFDLSNRFSRVRLLKEWGPQITPTRELDAQP